MSRMPFRSHRWGQFSCTPGERVTTCSCIRVGPSSVVGTGPSAVSTVGISISYRVKTSSTGLSPAAAPSTTAAIAGSRRRRSATSRAGSRSPSSSTLLIRTTILAPAGTFRRPPSGSAMTRATSSGVMGAPRGAPVKRATCSGRCTCSASSVWPRASAPTTGTTRVVSRGIAGSCGAGALNGRPRDPSAALRRHARGNHARRSRNSSGEIPAARPVAGSVTPMTSRCRCVSSAAATRSRVASAARTWAGASAICSAKICVVLVVSTRSPRSASSRARRNIAVVLPPPPTSATTSPAPIPSASTRVNAATGTEASAASTRRRAVDQLLGARLDPRKEARHHHAHAEPCVALDVAEVDQGAGHTAGLDDLLDRAVDRLLDVRVPHVADLAHRGRQVTRRHEEAVDLVDLEDLVERAHGDDVFDQDDEKALVVGGLEITVDAEALPARVHAALAERRELAGRDDRVGLGAGVDVRHHDALRASVERAVNRGVVVVHHAHDRRRAPEVTGARQVAELAEVDGAVLALEPDAVDVERAELVDQVRIIGAGDDRRDLAGRELLLHAIGSDVHGAS